MTHFKYQKDTDIARSNSEMFTSVSFKCDITLASSESHSVFLAQEAAHLPFPHLSSGPFLFLL